MTLTEQLNALAPLAAAAAGNTGRILFVCDSCGEEVGDGEQNNGCCPNCGGRSLSPNGWCDDEEETLAAFIAAARNLLTPANIAALLAAVQAPASNA